MPQSASLGDVLRNPEIRMGTLIWWGMFARSPGMDMSLRTTMDLSLRAAMLYLMLNFFGIVPVVVMMVVRLVSVRN